MRLIVIRVWWHAMSCFPLPESLRLGDPLGKGGNEVVLGID